MTVRWRLLICLVGADKLGRRKRRGKPGIKSVLGMEGTGGRG